MKVICNSIGSVPSYSNVPVTECSLCGAAKPHDNDSCEPCPWNKEARCVPVAPEHHVTFDQTCGTCGKRFKGNVESPVCPSCYI